MDSRWLKGLDPESVRKRKEELKSGRRYYDLAIEVLQKELLETTPDYSSPSWAYEQADVNGANRKLKQVIKLLTIED